MTFKLSHTGYLGLDHRSTLVPFSKLQVRIHTLENISFKEIVGRNGNIYR